MAGRYLPRIGNFPGRNTFKGAVRQGHNTGVPDTISVGEATFTQRAEISASETSATTVFVLPSDNEGGAVRSDLLKIDVLVDVIFEASADGTIEFTLGSAAGTKLGEVHVSADGQYAVVPGGEVNNNGTIAAIDGSAAANWLDVAGQAILAKVSAAGTAPDTGHAYVVLHYVPR